MTPTSGDLAQPTRLDLVDIAANGVLVWNERACLDTSDGLAHEVAVGLAYAHPLSKAECASR